MERNGSAPNRRVNTGKIHRQSKWIWGLFFINERGRKWVILTSNIGCLGSFSITLMACSDADNPHPTVIATPPTYTRTRESRGGFGRSRQSPTRGLQRAGFVTRISPRPRPRPLPRTPRRWRPRARRRRGTPRCSRPRRRTLPRRRPSRALR